MKTRPLTSPIHALAGLMTGLMTIAMAAPVHAQKTNDVQLVK